MNKVIRMIQAAAVILVTTVLTEPVFALQDWTAVPAACAGTDNNFYSGTPSAAFPVARFIVPGGRLSFMLRIPDTSPSYAMSTIQDLD
jgi:hypothetical protein